MLAGVRGKPTPEFEQGAPQLLSVGQVMNHVIGTLSVAGPLGGETTTIGAASARTIDLAHAKGLTTQMRPALPSPANVDCAHTIATRQKPMPSARHGVEIPL